MTPTTVSFDIPDWIMQGLQSGALERIGGVVRNSQSKQVVAWLRDYSPGIMSAVIGSPAAPMFGVADLVVKGIGFSVINTRLDTIQSTLQNVAALQGLTAGSVLLNLGLTAMGFAAVLRKLEVLEKRLQGIQSTLDKINYKLDLSFYANFKAALDLATNAFNMTKLENRMQMTMQAINRFLEAEHYYKDYATHEVDKGGKLAVVYLETLCLAYVVEAYCHLELEETETAQRRLQEGQVIVTNLIRRTLETLLTSNPAAYLRPEYKDVVKGIIPLSRLTQIFRWLDPTIDERTVFEQQRENLFQFANLLNFNKGGDRRYVWSKNLPDLIIHPDEIGTRRHNREETLIEALNRLPQVMKLMESIIEMSQRFESYQAEISAMQQFGLTFREWQQLAAPSEPNQMMILTTHQTLSAQ